jgi:hypothetical protein
LILAQGFTRLRSDAEQTLLALCINYRPFERTDSLNSWGVEGFPDLVVMEGGKIAAHDDGGDFYQPLVVVRNHGAGWSIRGASQKVGSIEPQIPGQIIVLDISKMHCVSGRNTSPWLALCFNPSRSAPLKSECTIAGTILALKQAAIDLGLKE